MIQVRDSEVKVISYRSDILNILTINSSVLKSIIPHELKVDNFLRELQKVTFFLGKFILGCSHVLRNMLKDEFKQETISRTCLLLP